MICIWKKLNEYYYSVIQHHKRELGYINSIDPYTFQDDSSGYSLTSLGTGIIANKIFSTIKPSTTVKIIWTTIGDTYLEEPFIETFYDSGWFDTIKFNYAKKEIHFEMIIGEGTVTFPEKIVSVIINDEAYTNFDENILQTISGTNSYTVRLAK